MRRYVLIAFLSFLSSFSFATDDYLAIAREAKNRAPEQMSVYRQDAENAKKTEKNFVKFYQDDARLAVKQEKEILRNAQLSGKINANAKKMPSTSMKKAGKILIFVSFSMPNQSLEAYLHGAKRIHASVVVRGLIDNSFQKTFKRIADLVKATGGEGVELNPIWFRRFGIQVVPTVVIVPEGSSCLKSDVCKKDHDYEVMTGNITLSYALKFIRDRGNLTSDIAQVALDELQDGANA